MSFGSKKIKRSVLLLVIIGIIATAIACSPVKKAPSDPVYGGFSDMGLLNYYSDVKSSKSLVLEPVGEGGSVFSGSVTLSGDYIVKLNYNPQTLGASTEASILVENNDKLVELPSVFLDKPVVYEPITQDEYGNDVRAKTAISDKQTEMYVRPKTGLYNDPVSVHLEAGQTTVTIKSNGGSLKLISIELVMVGEAPAYTELKDFYTESGWTDAPSSVKIQSEDIYMSNSSSLSAQYDRSDALTEPQDAYKLRLNIAGGSAWRNDGEWMEWKVDIPYGGLYAIRVKARQNMKSGAVSNRRCYVDGKVPCTEMNTISFPYSSDWKIVTLNAGEDEILLPLEKGEHTIRLEIVPGALAEETVKIKELVKKLNDIYRQIIMVTGANPDQNRDYYLERDIDGLTRTLQGLSAEAYAREEAIKQLAGDGGADLVSLSVIAEKLDDFARNPDVIAKRLGSFKSDIDGLAAWLLTVSEQPLDIDYIEFATPGSKIANAKANFFESLWFGTNALLASFLSEKQNDKDVVNVWINAGASGGVNIGRDQLTIIQSLFNDYFTPESGIPVSVSLVSQGINDAIIAGTGPDLVLYAPEAEVAPIAMRQGIESLDDYDGFDSLMSEIQPQARIPYEYKGNTYAVPLTQVFPLMFVRTDILEELDIKVPETWGDLKKVIPVVYRHNMQVGIPFSDSIFASMLYQQGMGFYGDDGLTTLKSDVAVSAFREYTRLFTDYGLPIQYDFFNRFRSGEMPIALADYTEYGRLSAAAPDIAGLWSVYRIPGTDNEGAIDPSVTGGGLGGYMLSASNKKAEAWEALKWFASSEAQALFGNQNEAMLGITGRYAPANTEAFEQLGWSSVEKALIKSQREYVKAIPQPAGAYYLSRNLTNAFRAVIIDAQNPREALYKYANEIDRELKRKKEAGL